MKGNINMKKIIAMILSLAMVLALAVSASAATITINGGADGSEYSAWKLLNTKDLGESKYDVSVNETYRNILQKIVFDNKTEDDEWADETDVTDAEIIAYISGLTGDAVRAFADAVYAAVKGMDADYTTLTDEIEDVDQGYYLIAETKTKHSGHLLSGHAGHCRQRRCDRYNQRKLSQPGKEGSGR